MLGQLMSKIVGAVAGPSNAALSASWLNLARYATAQSGASSGGAMWALGSAHYTSALRALADSTMARPLALQWLALPAYYHRDGLLAFAAYATAMSSAYARMAGVVAPSATALRGFGGYT